MTSSPSASTTSLVTVSDTATISSRAPLVPRKDTKDFSDAFSSLQSTYGFGAAPAPVARKTPKTRPPAPAPPVSPQPTGVPKDYQAAFGDLQSSFGFGMTTGPGPVPKSRPSRKHLAPAPAPARAVAGPAPKPKGAPRQKDYAAAFGQLQSSFGFGESTGPHPVAKTAAVKDGGAPPLPSSRNSFVHPPKNRRAISILNQYLPPHISRYALSTPSFHAALP
uniref:Proteophosphoglycan 5 n=1 Tax=Mycena chlorophos TaxID=658473 RepID=A0ABQ0LZV2_MYCCL|nr:predicted protein [Mycena chlorophos]